MLSDVEICHLQRSIAFHRRKQADEIKSRDYTISSLQSEIRSLGSITSKHQDQFMAIKEKLVVALTEVETQRILLDGERKRSAAADASLEQAENAFQLARQEKDFVRKQLAEAEGLIALSSQHRSRAQEQETALLHSREQLRILTDVKNSLDSQLAAAVRDLEVNKFKSASLELKTEAVSHEKVSLTEVVTELKQQLSKMQIKNAEEVSEIRRELLRAKDLVESERLMRMKSHSDSEMQRIKELEDRSKEAEEKYRLSQIPSVNEKETKLSLELEAMSQELVGKERERVLEAEKVSTLGLQLSTMQIQLDANLKRALEMDERYDAIRAEGRYARQQVLDMVGFVTDIITATCLNGNLQDEVLQQGQKSLRVSADSMRAPGHILLLSPRAKAAIKDGGLVHLKDCRSPAKRLFPDESNKCIVEHDPFDLAILHGLNDALCLPDLRSVLQTLRDRFEKVFTTAQQPEVKILNVDTSDKNAIRNLQLTLEASETTIKILENNVRVLQTKEAELIKTINQLDSEIKNHQVLTKKKDRTNAVLESELKIKSQLDAERALLHSQVASLQEQVATLTIDAHGTVRSSIESTEYSAREQETQIAIDQSAAPAFADKQSPPVNLSEVDNEENGTITGPFVTDADQSVGLESMPQRTEVSASIHSVLSVGSQLDDPFGTMNPLASQLHVVDDMQCEFTAAQVSYKD